MLGCIKYSKDKEKLSSFIRNNTRMTLERNAARVIQTITSITRIIESHDHPLSGWHVLPLEGDITCLRPEGALKSANCTTFTAAPKLGAFSVLPYSGVASKEACWFALTSYFRSKRDLLIVFLHRLTRERVDILY